MKRFWFLTVLSLFLISPLVIGCSSEMSQESAREQVEREDAEAPDLDDEEDPVDEDEDGDEDEEGAAE